MNADEGMKGLFSECSSTVLWADMNWCIWLLLYFVFNRFIFLRATGKCVNISCISVC